MLAEVAVSCCLYGKVKPTFLSFHLGKGVIVGGGALFATAGFTGASGLIFFRKGAEFAGRGILFPLKVFLANWLDVCALFKTGDTIDTQRENKLLLIPKPNPRRVMAPPALVAPSLTYCSLRVRQDYH